MSSITLRRPLLSLPGIASRWTPAASIPSLFSSVFVGASEQEPQIPTRIQTRIQAPRRLLSTKKKTNKMLQSNRLKQSMQKGPSMGLWQMLPGSNISRALARTPGVDWIMVDCEHGLMDGALDSGAHGILVPLIRTVDEVKTLVASAKFPPEGQRGFGSPFSMQNFSPVPSMTEYLQQANAALLTMVQIETREALEAVDDIAPLVDVLFVGPFDLGNNIGHPILDGKVAPQLEAAIEKVRAAAEKAGIKSGIFCSTPEQARAYAARGFQMVSVATDVTALQAVMAESVAFARGEAKPAKGGSY